MGERNEDGFGEAKPTGVGHGRDDERAQASPQERQGPGRQNTTARAEAERRARDERVQREHPDFIAGRGRDPGRDAERDPDLDADLDAPVDADDDSERFRARENEDQSEG